MLRDEEVKGISQGICCCCKLSKSLFNMLCVTLQCVFSHVGDALASPVAK